MRNLRVGEIGGCGMKEMYFVEKDSGSVMVSIMRNRMDNKYHFVNLTKDHICACGFDSVEDAVNDMEKLKNEGIIINYCKI